jgi:hypothetical protein
MNKLLFTISNYKVIRMRRMGGVGVKGKKSEEWSYLADSK